MTQGEHTGSDDRPEAETPPPAARPTRRVGAALQHVAIGVLTIVAATAPFIVPAVAPQTALAISQANPFVDWAHQRAERSVVVSPNDIQTLWGGLPEARADRARTPLWVREALDMPRRLTALEALGQRPIIVELSDAPWARDADLAERGGAAAVRTTADAPRPTVSETLIAGLPGVGPTALDVVLSSIQLSAPPVGPTAASIYAPPPAARAEDTFLERSLDALTPALPSDLGAMAIPRPIPRPAARSGPGGVVIGPQERAEQERAEEARAEEERAEEERAARERAARERAGAAAAAGGAPAAAPVRAPEISVVLTAVGLNKDATVLANAILPPQIAFAVPPIAPDASALVGDAIVAGRVALLETPLESDVFPRVNAAPLTLLAGASRDRNPERLTNALSATPGVAGVATYLGDRFVQDDRALEAFIRELDRRGLFLVAADPRAARPVSAAARRVGARSLVAGVALDDGGNTADLSAGLATLEALARRSGRAVGVAVAVPASVSALADWAAGLEARGIRLTPIAP